MRVDNIYQRLRRGFTLVELLIVIIVIAVLAAIAIPKFANSSQRGKESALKADLKVLRNAVDLFKTDTGAYPGSIADLAATSAPANGKDSAGANKAINASDWRGPYLQSVPTDPISDAAYTYSTAAGTVGKVSSSAGAPYDTW